MRVKIIGAGSIGNHLAQASRRAGWEVHVTDIDPEALKRMTEDIYPRRYGAWDPAIELHLADRAPRGGFDVIFIGTPPDSHFALALEALQEKPRLLQIEKPLGPPLIGQIKSDYERLVEAIKAAGIPVVVGYEYVLSESARKILDFILKPELGRVELLEVSFREHWSGIFAAHPWLHGPEDSYLGYSKRGGGASGEHSHAIHFWQYLAWALGLGEIAQVSAMLDMVRDRKTDYDRLCSLHVRTMSGFSGRIVQDVVTNPPKLSLRIQREGGYVEWERFSIPGEGPIAVITRGLAGEPEPVKERIKLRRPDDFYEEICHLRDLLEGRLNVALSPMCFETGAHTLKVVTAAHLSAARGGASVSLSSDI